jgi:acetoacetyl-CoA reductase
MISASRVGNVGRIGEADEIAHCVLFLASEDAGFITDSTLTSNGGQYMP